MSKTRSWAKRLTVLTAAAVAAVAVPGTAEAATHDIALTCKTRLSGEWLDVTGYSRGVDVTAPATVAPGSTFTVSIDPQPIYPVPAFNQTLRHVTWSYALPGNARLVGHSLTGGSALNGSTVGTLVVGSTIAVWVSGPLPGGVEFDIPTLNLQFQAPASGTMQVKAGGTGYDAPGFGWTRLQPDTQEWDPFLCYPTAPAPVLSSTAVSGP